MMTGRPSLIIVLCLMVIFALPANVWAQDPPPDTGLTVDCNRIVTIAGTPTIERPCTIQDFFEQFVRLAQFAYSIIALLAVLMIVYGGYQFLTAAGREEKVSNGRRIITGTVTGLIISFTAYVIVNFTVSAITDSPIHSLNPLGGIARVFSGRTVDDKRIDQPFSGTGGGAGESCLNWDKTCDGTNRIYQAYCTDPTPTGGKIRGYKQQLNDLGCGCSGSAPNGCFDANMVNCVRRFQIAIGSLPSGALDNDTKQALDNGPAVSCTMTSVADLVSKISAKLPSPNLSFDSLNGKNAKDPGCCVVASQSNAYYCLSNVTERTCLALGSNNTYASGANNCLSADSTKNVCGVCLDSAGKCINSGKYWCQTIVSPPQDFRISMQCPGAPNNPCSAGCLDGLRHTAPFQ